MPTLQALKKKLAGVRSIQKFAKAMKNISTMKFSRLNARFAAYSEYASQVRLLYESCRFSYDAYYAPKGTEENEKKGANAPEALVVIASNRGLCGDFNRKLLMFAEEQTYASEKPYAVYLCGKKAESWFREKKLPFEKAFDFSDIPKYSEMQKLYSCLKAELEDGGISGIRLVFSKYSNMLLQTPVLRDLLSADDETAAGEKNAEQAETLFVPDKESFIKNTADEIPEAILYNALLESALGAQAATLMTMRSAYDTATEYRAALEGEINRKRQAKVTADVIESSADRPREEES